jgi:tRNA (guanine26-N2/guanine27-N2)-dimethyltransferase
MAADRDLGVAFVRARFPGGGATGWDMLAATGARGLRLANEGGGFRSFLLTEANAEAAEVLAHNAVGVPGTRTLCTDVHREVPGTPFDYVDLDPYGSPLRFVPEAIRATVSGGVLGVTATDLIVLAGAQVRACERRYGATPIRGRLGPEAGLRILLGAIAREARAQDRRLRPLLSYVRDHHVRAYVELLPLGPSDAPDPVGVIDPAAWDGPLVGGRGPYGPLWLGPLFDRTLVEQLRVPAMAACPSEVQGLLDRMRAESAVDRPFYYEANEIAGALALPRPGARDAFQRALVDRGYRCAPTHARPEGFRTDAPRGVVEDVARSLAAG